MTDGFASIIAELERQKMAIERALEALHGVGGIEMSASANSVASKTKAPEAGQNRRSEAQKKRWAAKKAAEVMPAENASKGGMTPEGRQKLADAMKKRWAAKRAGSVVKKTVRKRAAKEAA